MNRLADFAVTLVELGGVLRALPHIESARRHVGPRPLMETLRRQARHTRQRGPMARQCLQRAIRWVDVCLAGGANCYRRALLEVALDRGAAEEPLALGLSAQGQRLAGHAWLAGEPGAAAAYDLVIHV